jgi:hypothetical protein
MLISGNAEVQLARSLELISFRQRPKDASRPIESIASSDQIRAMTTSRRHKKYLVLSASLLTRS